MSTDLWKVESTPHCITGCKGQRQLQGTADGDTKVKQTSQSRKPRRAGGIWFRGRQGWHGAWGKGCVQTPVLFSTSASHPALYSHPSSSLGECQMLLWVWLCDHVIQGRTRVKCGKQKADTRKQRRQAQGEGAQNDAQSRALCQFEFCNAIKGQPGSTKKILQRALWFWKCSI